MTQAALDMYDYHVWANKTMLGRLKELPREVYRQQVQSVLPSVSFAMAHIYIVDSTWLSILSGTDMREAIAAANEVKEQAEAASIEELEAMMMELSERYKAFFKRQDSMERTIVLDNPYAGVCEKSLSEIVLQVVNHATYHRGNVTAMLRQMGHASTMTEYALYWYAK
ncbi:DinB family protein [Paenibacillus doosanensis]|uniref:DinB family protein n=1 Tax=Paenibacillus konkukensis TaxID=2020716 RepID=A0ABY4RUW9_9BACL|nr:MULTISPECIES: DinB family protein [Paenibacillus]MCS7463294.1 DinB family protein [Paenibacillus doosanensis]UQZ85169.1 DinB family protein [Paenibacillus konkukensis]